MLFGVPTMYHRLAEDCRGRPGARRGARPARGCWCPARPRCPATTTQRIAEATGQRVVERYGMTETLMNYAACAPTASRSAGRGGPAAAGRRPAARRRRRRARSTRPTARRSGRSRCAGRTCSLGYLNRPDATGGGHARRLVPHRRHGGARRRRLRADRRPQGHRPDQERRLQDRRGRDRERAARAPGGARRRRSPGSPTRTWASGSWPGSCRRARSRRPSGELADHVAGLLAPHKRPRVVRLLEDSLPRNDMGKVMKRALDVPERLPAPVLALVADDFTELRRWTRAVRARRPAGLGGLRGRPRTAAAAPVRHRRVGGVRARHGRRARRGPGRLRLPVSSAAPGRRTGTGLRSRGRSR